MPHDELRSAIDTISTRLQAELQAQLAALEERQAHAIESARREAETAAEARSEARWTAQIEAARQEWTGRLDTELAAARSDAEQRAAAESTQVRAQVEQRAADAVAGVREDLEQALAGERERARTEIEHERERARTELAGERSRLAAELEREGLKARALAAALEEAAADTAHEREAARLAVETQESRHAARSRDALTEARAAERQAQLAVVERLLGAVRAIAAARSLSDTLTALVTAAGSEAPRAALFIVQNERELQGWRTTGFDAAPESLQLTADGDDLIAEALRTGVTISTTAAPSPAFAALPGSRAALAVPVTVGGQAVAVLYADGGSPQEPEAPASWPEALQILGAHASICLAHLTALRTAHAMHIPQSPARSAMPVAAAVGSEDDNSARRYARLLVSEIKLYNENAVRLGREKRDLLERLRPEIDRARRLYEDRVSPSVGARGLYFQQELVQTLADGDPALLGASTT